MNDYEIYVSHKLAMMLKEAGWDVLDTDGAIQPSKACIEVVTNLSRHLHLLSRRNG